jgi:hypothetical protein
MLLQSADRQVSLDCPGSYHQADRRNGRTSDKEKVHIPLEIGSRFVQQAGPGQESVKQCPDYGLFSLLLGLRPLSYTVTNTYSRKQFYCNDTLLS